MLFQNDKMSFNEASSFYEHIKAQTFTEKLNTLDFIKVSKDVYLRYCQNVEVKKPKLFSNTLQRLKTMELSQTQRLVIHDQKSQARHLNTNLIHSTMFMTGSAIQYPLVIYKNRFTLRPLSMIFILLEEEQKFNFVIYNTNNGSTEDNPLHFDKVVDRIPNLKYLLKLGCFNQIGRRLFSCFKNQIIMNQQLITKKMSKIEPSKEEIKAEVNNDTLSINKLN